MVNPKLLAFSLFLAIFLSLIFTLFTWIALPEMLALKYFSAIFFLLLCLVVFFFKRKKLEKVYASSWFKNFSSSLLFTLLVFAILALLNYLSFKNPISFDLTAMKSNSLSQKTKDVLASLKKPIEVLIIAKKEEIKLARTHLELYRILKKDLVIQEFDIDLRPDLVNKYEITSSPSLVLVSSNKHEVVSELLEKDLTNALVRLNRQEQLKIYFSTGHQEIDFFDETKEGASIAREKLNSLGYELSPLHLGTVKNIPSDASLFILMGPRVDFSENEINVLENYMERGGRFLLSLDPNFRKDSVPSLRSFLKNKGIQIENDMVIDQLSNAQGSSGIAPIVKKFSTTHEATKSFEGIVFFPLVSSVRASSKDVSFHPLALSSEFPASWAEKDLSEYEKGHLQFHHGVDLEGPITLLAQLKGGPWTAIVSGNSNFIINGYAEQGHNQKLFSNLISALLNESTLLSFDSPETNKAPVIISDLQLKVIFFFSVLFSPLLLAGASIFCYRRSLS